jgi:sulfur-oxidizing protein SoxB
MFSCAGRRQANFSHDARRSIGKKYSIREGVVTRQLPQSIHLLTRQSRAGIFPRLVASLILASIVPVQQKDNGHEPAFAVRFAQRGIAQHEQSTITTRRSSMNFPRLAIASLALGLVSGGAATGVFGDDGTVRLIHTGDIHGHLVPRPNVRSDSTGKMEGGLARMYTVIKQIRSKSMQGRVNTSLLINTGDTVQGSGEALFTRGQAMIDVVNLFGIDADAPGNWDFLYGAARFEEMFKGVNGNPPLANWHAMASNLYYTNQFDDTAVCGVMGTDPATGTARPYKRVLPTYMIKQVGKVKVGILGFTTARAIAAVGTSVTKNYQFTDAKVELPCFIDKLRNQEKVDLLVMISELELARDIKLVEANAGVDVVLNSDMHEKTVQPIVIHHLNAPDTLLLEEGQDGTMVGELKLEVKYGKVAEWEFHPHVITSDIDEDKTVKAKIAAVRKPFLKNGFVAGQQVTVGGNTTTLLRPVDEIVAYTQIDLHRSNFMDEDMAGVVEGSSHDLITDAMRWAGGTDAAAIRGFRYGTHVPAGWPITMEDIYHYIPIAAKLGKSPKACGYDLKFQAENSTAGVFHPDPTQWQGGWMFGYSNVSYDLDACAGFAGDGTTDRATNIKVGGVAIDVTDKYNPSTQACASGASSYAVAGYWYADDPTTINNCAPCRGRLIQVTKADGTTVDVAGPGVSTTLPDSNSLLDITEAVVRYLQAPAAQGGIGNVVTASNLPLHRINVKRLPTINPYPFKVVQPLNGSTPTTCPVL